MAPSRRLRVLLSSRLPLVASIVALVLLAAGLSGLELMPFRLTHSTQATEQPEPPLQATPGSEVFGILWMILVFSGLFLLLVGTVLFLFSSQFRKQVLRRLAPMVWLWACLLVSMLVTRTRDDLPGELEVTPPAPPVPLAAEGVSTPALELTAGFPQWAVLLATLGLAALLAAALVGAAWFLQRRARAPKSPLEQLARQAQQALLALESGADVRDTVLRCYFEMSRVLSEQRGIKRADPMTPREFERQLEEAGLPTIHIERLTRLFEGVRYGAKIPGEGEERQAVACLMAIVELCGSPA